MFEKLNSNVTISRQFLKSVNLEADLGRTDALQGYLCQDTAKSLVKNMAHHLNNTRQKAFTWTGPYGGAVVVNKDVRSFMRPALSLLIH